jgi:ectoine hydroxylase-related dioxygenase (phytanoyl-CoA dioxygenase family)
MKTPTPGSLPQPSGDLQQLIANIDEHGYCLIAEALDEPGIAAVRERLAAQARAEQRLGHHKLAPTQDVGGINQWVYMLLNKGKVFQRLLFHPLVSAVTEHLIGGEYLLGDISAHITRPGNSLLPLHIDQWWMPPPVRPRERHVRPGSMTRDNVPKVDGMPPICRDPINAPVVVNAMWMISDYTEANGATHLVPGSHLSGALPAPSVPHEVPTARAVAPAGTVVLWDGRTWHSAGENKSNEPRYGITTYYSGPQFRSLQNHTLGSKAALLDGASPELLTLLGFRAFGGYGHTGERDAEFARPSDGLVGELG